MRRNPQVIFDTVDEILILLHTGSGEFFELNPTSAFIWNVCEDCVLEDLIAALREEFPDEDRDLLETDCREFLTNLEEAGLLDKSPAIVEPIRTQV